MKTDPVCGMEVKEESPHRRIFRGAEFRFCSEHCLEKFNDNPEAYLGDDCAVDPVCGMRVPPSSTNRIEHEAKAPASAVKSACSNLATTRAPTRKKQKRSKRLRSRQQATGMRPTSAPCVPVRSSRGRVAVRNAAWHWSR